LYFVVGVFVVIFRDAIAFTTPNYGVGYGVVT
jgi:hypothetical protein